MKKLSLDTNLNVQNVRHRSKGRKEEIEREREQMTNSSIEIETIANPDRNCKREPMYTYLRFTYTNIVYMKALSL